jgi:hypothetical protein
LVYALLVEHNGSGEKIYREMHKGDWWWETQVR